MVRIISFHTEVDVQYKYVHTQELVKRSISDVIVPKVVVAGTIHALS